MLYTKHEKTLINNIDKLYTIANQGGSKLEEALEENKLLVGAYVTGVLKAKERELEQAREYAENLTAALYYLEQAEDYQGSIPLYDAIERTAKLLDDLKIEL